LTINLFEFIEYNLIMKFIKNLNIDFQILMFYYKDLEIYKAIQSRIYVWNELTWKSPRFCRSEFVCVREDTKVYENKDALRCTKYRNADHDI